METVLDDSHYAWDQHAAYPPSYGPAGSRPSRSADAVNPSADPPSNAVAIIALQEQYRKSSPQPKPPKSGSCRNNTIESRASRQ